MSKISIFQSYYNGKYGEDSISYKETDIEFEIKGDDFIGTIITSREFYSEKIPAQHKEQDNWKRAIYKCTFDEIPDFIKKIFIYNIKKLPEIIKEYKEEYSKLDGPVDQTFSIEIDDELYEYSTLNINSENHKKAINFIEYFNPFQALSNKELYNKTNLEIE